MYKKEYDLVKDAEIHIEKAKTFFPAYQRENHFLHQLTEKEMYYLFLALYHNIPDCNF